MSKVKFKTGVKYICDNCGFSDDNLSCFNDADCDTEYYCLKCHPHRMSYRQLIEWLAKGNGYLCQQGKDYTIAPIFSMSPVIINDKHYAGRFDDQIPYNEHELVVSEFKDGFSNWKIPTLEMYKRDCGRPLNKTFPNELKADEKLCIKYEKEWIDECRKNENKIISYTAISSEKVEELESLIRSAENIFDVLLKRGIILMWNKFTDHYSVMVKDK